MSRGQGPVPGAGGTRSHGPGVAKTTAAERAAAKKEAAENAKKRRAERHYARPRRQNAMRSRRWQKHARRSRKSNATTPPSAIDSNSSRSNARHREEEGTTLACPHRGHERAHTSRAGSSEIHMKAFRTILVTRPSIVCSPIAM